MKWQFLSRIRTHPEKGLVTGFPQLSIRSLMECTFPVPILIWYPSMAKYPDAGNRQMAILVTNETGSHGTTHR